MVPLPAVLRNPFKLVVESSVSGEVCFHSGFFKTFFFNQRSIGPEKKKIANNVIFVETMQSGIICSAKGHSNKTKQCTHPVECWRKLDCSHIWPWGLLVTHFYMALSFQS